jgi:hypothetical protein
VKLWVITMTDDLRLAPPDDYLWDRSGPIDPDVAALEQSLGALKFDPARRPLRLPARRGLRATAWLALAAAAVVAAGAGAFWWRLQWPDDRAWRLSTTTSGIEQVGTLAVGQTIDLGNATEASLSIARLGTARVHAGSAVRLRATSSRRHTLQLTKGTIDVSVWAPPSRVTIGTPAGTVIDLGCVFSITVDAAGVAHVRVDTGWVQLENKFGETLVPAGASSDMMPDVPPVVPVYDDATAQFRDAVRLIEIGGTPKIDFALSLIDRDARARDVPTLLLLALRSPQMPREALLARAALLVPPPAPVGKTLDLTDAAIWRWFDTLPLPPAKAWWLNWKDLFHSPR